jgi:predicted transcriptional regulator
MKKKKIKKVVHKKTTEIKEKEYVEKVEGRFEDIYSMRENGFTMQMICEELGISRPTFNKYIKNHKDLADLMVKSQKMLDKKTEEVAKEGLFSKLQDKFVEEVTEEIWSAGKDDFGQEIIAKKHILKKKRFIPADTTAIIFALKSKNPKIWNTDEHKLSEMRAKLAEAKVKTLDENGREVIDELIEYLK